MKTYIQAEVSTETHHRFATHPIHRGKTQRETADEIMKKWLDSPEAQIPQLKEQISSLSNRVEWLSRQLDDVRKLELRVRALERREQGPASQAAS